MINPLILYSAIGAFALGAASGWTARDWKADSDKLAVAEAQHKAERAVNTAVEKPAQDLETALATLRPREIETRNTIREVYKNVEVPVDCAVPPAGVSLLDNARKLADAATTGELVAELHGDTKAP